MLFAGLYDVAHRHVVRGRTKCDENAKQGHKKEPACYAICTSSDLASKSRTKGMILRFMTEQ